MTFQGQTHHKQWKAIPNPDVLDRKAWISKLYRAHIWLGRPLLKQL